MQKNDQTEFKSNLSEIKKGGKNIDQKSKKINCITLNALQNKEQGY